MYPEILLTQGNIYGMSFWMPIHIFKTYWKLILQIGTRNHRPPIWPCTENKSCCIKPYLSNRIYHKKLKVWPHDGQSKVHIRHLIYVYIYSIVCQLENLLLMNVLVAEPSEYLRKGMSLTNLLKKTLQWVSLPDKTTFRFLWGLVKLRYCHSNQPFHI